MRVLVTGGAGYIGSHTLLELLATGHEVLVLDNYSNSSPEALERVARLSNRQFARLDCDLRDDERVLDTFRTFRPDAVVHFAGLKAVAESVEKPLLYYDNNVRGSVSLIRAMQESGCTRIVFSSSATVYGVAQSLPYDETHPLAPINPYGRSKLTVERMLSDWAEAEAGAAAILLRYFNPVGAHASALIGEDPLGIPNNLMPILAQVAIGRRPQLRIYGDDYDTPDGTAIRDYIHVVDLARAHLKALELTDTQTGAEPINIGTGRGASVLEVVSAFERASNRRIPFEFTDRRPGDLAVSVADPAKAHRLLGWHAEHDLAEMCRSVWAWQSRNPNGYAG